jgi:RimJ/RimL family protein N-acetyltransferase
MGTMSLDLADAVASVALPTNSKTSTAAKGCYLFYCADDVATDHISLPEGYGCSIWRPSIRSLWPPGTSDRRTWVRFAFRCALDFLRLFANRSCGAVCVFFEGQLVHYSGFTPRYWRFPFLADSDLQIGDTWTAPAHRGKGIARYALHRIVEWKKQEGRKFWYVVAATNAPSIRVVEGAGFTLAGEGAWDKPFGMKALGSYNLNLEF